MRTPLSTPGPVAIIILPDGDTWAPLAGARIAHLSTEQLDALDAGTSLRDVGPIETHPVPCFGAED